MPRLIAVGTWREVVKLERDAIIHRVIALLKDRLEEDDVAIGPDTRLMALGVDSVDIAYILAYFEKEYDIELDDDAFDPGRYTSVAGVADLIYSNLIPRP